MPEKSIAILVATKAIPRPNITANKAIKSEKITTTIGNHIGKARIRRTIFKAVSEELF